MSEPKRMAHLPPILPSPKNGSEPLRRGAASAGATVLEFWRWAYSDLLVNTTRGVLAEFVVATAIGARRPVRDPWQAFDLETPSGVTIEVKSSSYVQSWGQRELSKPSFAIGAKRAPVEGTGAYELEQRWQAQVYVFCLLTAQEKAQIDPLDLDGWEFLVVPTARFERELPRQKRISLAALRRLGVRPCGFGDLLSSIEEAARAAEPD